jgi:hypothetical protein
MKPSGPSPAVDLARASSPVDRAGRNIEHHASTCRWAVPTIFLPAPFWWQAEDRPWACVRGETPRLLETTEACAECPHWDPLPRQPTADVATIEALREALEDAYRARAACRKVIDAFGPVPPFVSIMRAEERDAGALRAHLDRVGVEPPRDTWPARVSAPDTLVEACAAAGRAALERTAMYERLIPLVPDPATRRVMRRIHEVSKRRHLPALRRCFARAMKKPAGRPRGVRTGRSGP